MAAKATQVISKALGNGILSDETAKPMDDLMLLVTFFHAPIESFALFRKFVPSILPGF
jgi:hypothetical protein